ncbi:hypothetical protein K3495_g5031 [Podosphaera aphanis]|nr:hypothetical protein K3495_g5031 [Podosphaera aphanis]
MRSFTLAFVSSLLLSSASATYSHEAESHAVQADTHGHAAVWVVMAGITEPDKTVAVHHPHGVTDHDNSGRYGFKCGKKFFSQKKIMRAADAACPKISDNKQNSKFPAVHTAFKYPAALGPYFEWPINRYGGFFNIFHKFNKSKYRVIMTTDCKVVGAVKRNKDKSYENCALKRH